MNSDTSITAISPASDAPDNVKVLVISIGGTSAVTPADQFTYVGAPVPGEPG